MVSGGLGWSWMVSDGLGWSQMVSDGLGWSVSVDLDTIEWFKTPKPISGIGWDWMGWMDLRVGGGIEHLTVLIKRQPEPPAEES